MLYETLQSGTGRGIIHQKFAIEEIEELETQMAGGNAGFSFVLFRTCIFQKYGICSTGR